MANKMLIDASHPEETRVVVLRGNRIEEFDFESASKKPLRGNIYLAKVTRVEPSLQAAFIDYDGNRHGFLAFSEIHPDYYQIPIADRQALLEEEADAHKREKEREDNDRHRRKGGGRNRQRFNHAQPSQGMSEASDHDTLSNASQENGQENGQELGQEQGQDPDGGYENDTLAHHAGDDANHEEKSTNFAKPLDDAHKTPADETINPSYEADFSARSQAAEAYHNDAVLRAELPFELHQHEHESSHNDERHAEDDDTNHAHATDYHDAPSHQDDGALESYDNRTPQEHDQDHGLEQEHDPESPQETVIEHIGGGDTDSSDDMPRRQSRLRRQYKIQEVIKRRQILLVQVVKEERGNKGAALTTYLSLAGRYCVLMPNTARGGGISRKITDNEDRDRLRAIVQELEVPEGMGVILRTAGATRTRQEIRRDFEYLMRMWEQVRETTLNSVAPTLVYEEGTLIKRTIRDLYNKDIDEVLVAGEEAYREARDYMAMLMPGDENNVKLWNEPESIFARTGVEAQLDGMFSNRVTLKSGGYLIINQTEALVAIDVNSGRSTREHNIEDTALRTNLEAADEVARQLRLRDLAGLIVIDFIDMEEGRNNRMVERRIKEALRNDRARIQVGRISPFGLLEISRQRMRTGVLEGSTIVCPHCQGSGTIRSTASIALYVLRAVEDSLIRSASYHLIVRAHSEVALYILNQKRAHLHTLEVRFGITIAILTDETLDAHEHYRLERGELALPRIVPDSPAISSHTPPYYDSQAPAQATYSQERYDANRNVAADVALRDPNYDETDDDSEGANSDEASAEEKDANYQNRAPRKRRRRRSNRNGGERAERALGNGGVPDILIDSEQPSDEGLAYVASLKPTPHARSLEGYDADRDGEPMGDFVQGTGQDQEAGQDQDGLERETTNPQGQRSGRDGNRRGSRRLFRNGRRRPRDDFGRNQERGQERNQESSQAWQETNQSEPDFSQGNHREPIAPAPLAAASPSPAPAPAPVIAPAPAPASTPASTPPSTIISVEPEKKPKRSGWWQRAKATFTGEES